MYVCTYHTCTSDILYSYALFLLQVQRNTTAAEEVLVRGVRVDPLSVPMNWAYGQFLLHGKGRRDQAKDSFQWVAEQEEGKYNIDVLAQTAALFHNPEGQLETRYVAGYSGLKQQKRERLRAVTRTEVPEGEESSELDAALDDFNPLAYRHNTRDPDHEKTVALVRDLPTAEGYYKRALALQPVRADATLGYCALLQEVGRDPAEIRQLYRQVVTGSMSHRTLLPTQEVSFVYILGLV